MGHVMNAHRRWRIVIFTIVACALLAAVAATVTVYSGLYDVAADWEHPVPVYDVMHTAMRRSIAARTHDIHVPKLDDPARIRAGFTLFRDHCVQCHGAPGVAPQPFAFGLRPMPPSLLIPAKEWPASHLYWVIRHGVRLTGMPAWGYRMDEQQMWDVTAFLKTLPGMSPAAYQRWEQQLASDASPLSAPPALRPGDPKAGRRAVSQYLCATCHKIPGIAGTDNSVGPSLAGIATRAYIAGDLKNSPDNMMRWLRDPHQIKPDTGMPNLRIREQDIRDITAFLYTLDKGK